jgi:hypothetical protein
LWTSLALVESPFRWRNTTIGLWSILANARAWRTEPLRSREIYSFSMHGCQIRKPLLSIIIIKRHYHVHVEIIER